MIIQCKQCKTKFRFDDALMEGDGLWMRCSRCQHVFFQDNPAKVKPAADFPAEPPVVKISDKETEKEVKRPSFEPATREPAAREPAAGTQDEDMKSFMKEVIGEEKKPEAEVFPAASPSQEEMHVADIDFSTTVDEMEQAQEAEEQEAKQQISPPKKKGRVWMVVLWVLLFNVFIFALLYFFAPQVIDTYTQIAQKYIGGSKATEGQVVMAQIRLQDIRQRIVNNAILGNIRVVEGTAVNQADFPVSRIRIKGEIMDARSLALGERVSFAGNVLTDEELANMSEDDIQKRLSRPEGRNNINEKVLPNGRIPFMIVFVGEKPGVIKTTVVVSGAERLL